MTIKIIDKTVPDITPWFINMTESLKDEGVYARFDEWPVGDWYLYIYSMKKNWLGRHTGKKLAAKFNINPHARCVNIEIKNQIVFGAIKHWMENLQSKLNWEIIITLI